MSNNEKQIEEAFKSHDAPDWGTDAVGRDAAIRWHMRGFNDALAVFEKAHTPTDDEPTPEDRETLGDLVLDAVSSTGAVNTWLAADLILAAGFRHSEVPEPSVEDFRQRIADERARQIDDGGAERRSGRAGRAMKLSEYVTQVINDPKYGHDIEWVKGNLHRAHMERIEAAHDAEIREHARHEFCDPRLGCVVAEEPEWAAEYAIRWPMSVGHPVSDIGGNLDELRSAISDRDPEWAEVVERRVTPWVPVKQEGAETDAV